MSDERMFESELHRQLGFSDKEIRCELEAVGLDPEEESEALRSMIVLAVRARENRQAIDRRLMALLMSRFANLD